MSEQEKQIQELMRLVRSLCTPQYYENKLAAIEQHARRMIGDTSLGPIA